MNQGVSLQKQRSEARFEQTLTITGPVTLDVSLRAGRVRVRRGEDGSVTIRGVLRPRRSILSWIHPEEAVENFLSNPPVRQDGNTIQIGDVGDRWLLRRVHFLVDVTVPAQTRLRALGDSADIRVEAIDGPIDCETDSGEIQIANINSQVSASSDSGAISIRQVTGCVDAETDSGEIEVLQIGGGIDVHTDTGRIRLSQTVPAPVYAHSDSGSISMKLASDGGGYTIRVRTDSGQIEIPELTGIGRTGHEVEGVVRGGGSVVAIETDAGDIEIV